MINILKTTIEEKNYYLVQYITNNKVIGSAQLETDLRRADLYRVFVEPKYRGLKIGSELVDACTELAKAEGCESIVLTIAKNNRNVEPFYTKLGFAFVMEWRDSGLWLFAKQLTHNQGALAL